ncbi:MAG: hypothetical protein GY950_28605, partial [bacterium]|nr:hypothetical protein [bacterium]
MSLRTVNIRAFVFIVCISFAWGLAALDPTRSIDQYVVEQWTTANGLPGNSVVAVSQTPDGYLWVGTRRQLTRFNGIKFTPYRLFNAGEAGYKEITAVKTDIDGDLWIGTRGPGLYKFTGAVDRRFTHKGGPSSTPL